MGTFGFAKIQIDFKKETPKEFTTLETLEAELKEFALGHYSLCDLNVGATNIELEMSSERLQNLDWQVRQLLNYIEEMHVGLLDEFNSSGYSESDYGSLYHTPEIVDPTPEELEQFYEDWGQSHEEICSCLGYDEDSAEDLLMDDYFWVEDKELWCNKGASGFTGRDREIVEFLRQ
jgi:hypothetical protein